MPKAPDPVGIPKLAAGTYEAELRRKIIAPALRRLRADLDDLVKRGLVTPEEVTDRINAVTRQAQTAAARYAPAAAEGHVVRTDRWHRRRFAATMRAAGIDLTLAAGEDAVREALERRIADNVRLIKTIPGRMHSSLIQRIQKQAADGWRFDPEFLSRTLQGEYKSTGWNLRRLTRDQTTKQIGQLTQIRQVQAGFKRYRWITAGDNRVRPEHEANDGLLFRWDDPPGTGHPGNAILCRCNAVAHVEDRDIQRARGFS